MTPFLTSQDVTNLLAECELLCNHSCKSQGFFLEKNVIKDCICRIEFKRRVKLIAANIPKKHQDFSFEVLSTKFQADNFRALEIMTKYRDKIDSMIEKGIGLYIQGQVGLAKSALSYSILQYAAERGIVCYATRMSKITYLTFQALSDSSARDQMEWILNDVKLLFIDEIEKDFKVGNTQEFSGTRVNEFFSSLYDSKKSLIITSNLPKNDLRQVHADNVVDRFQELADVILVGESFRKANTAIKEILA